MSTSGRMLIVGGRSYAIEDFDIFEHIKATDPLRGRFQYRLRTRGWWGPMVGYKTIRYVVTILYTKTGRWFEATVTATIAEEANPMDLDDYMMELAVGVLEEWGADVPWDEISVKDRETISHTDRFDSSIHIVAVDMNQHKTVVVTTETWTEDDMRHEAGLA